VVGAFSNSGDEFVVICIVIRWWASERHYWSTS